MSSFLSKKRTRDGFLEKISSEPAATRGNRIAAIKNFERFVKTKYEGRNFEEICEELSVLQGQEEKTHFMTCYKTGLTGITSAKAKRTAQ